MTAIMTKKKTKKQTHGKTIIKVLKDICDWTLIIALIFHAIVDLVPWTEDNVTREQGVISNVSLYTGRRAAWALFSIDEKEYYYWIVDSRERWEVQEALQKTADDGSLVTVSVTEQFPWRHLVSFRFLNFAGKERVVAIEGEGVDFPVTLLNRYQKIDRIVTLFSAMLLVLLKYFPQIVYFLVVNVERDKRGKESCLSRPPDKKIRR